MDKAQGVFGNWVLAKDQHPNHNKFVQIKMYKKLELYIAFSKNGKWYFYYAGEEYIILDVEKWRELPRKKTNKIIWDLI